MIQMYTVKLGYNELGYGELGYDELGYDEHGYDEQIFLSQMNIYCIINLAMTNPGHNSM